MAYTYPYPRPAVTTDIVVFSHSEGREYVLLIQRDRPPFEGCWALPGGFIEMEETLEASARRELEEETGLTVKELRQLHTYGDPGRDPRHRTITVVFVGSVDGLAAVKGMDDAREAAWHPIEELPPLGFDHGQIVRDAINAL